MSSITITLVQTQLFWEQKEANLRLLEEKINQLQQPTHVIVLPEMFNTGFSMRPQLLAEEMNGSTVEWMKRIAAEKRVILTGSLMVKEPVEAPAGSFRYYNRLVWMLPNGQCGVYDKRHLFGYAGEDQHFTPGNRRLVASVNGWRFHLQVCYDLRFPVWARQQSTAEPEYDVLLYVANWPERRKQAWRTLLQARAIENQCYVVGVNRVGADGNGIDHSGNSMVVDPMGDILYEKEQEEDLHTITLSKEHLLEVRSKLPFLKDADDFVIR